ncbi:MAG: glycosyltransferase family 9 protein [Flavobacteriales bacterium]|nr:glycosyltransferase family 9 protein [Flavobacteriales bacterium]
MSADSEDHQHIVISRTDSIGDVMLTLPVAGMLKKHLPNCKISFLGRAYTKAIIENCEHVDQFLDWDQIADAKGKDQLRAVLEFKADVIIHVFPVKEIARLAKKAEIPMRIGTTHRVFHLNTCNKLLNLGRKNSNLHETQLNLKLLTPLGIHEEVSLEEIPKLYGFTSKNTLTPDGQKALDHSRFNLIIHPRSKGSAREWGVENYATLLHILPKDRFNVILTGTKEEGAAIRGKLYADNPALTDLTGKLTLEELINFIGQADGLLAASTGPLHIASALGKNAVGLYAPMRPIHPGRWAPVGPQAKHFVLHKKCSDCKTNGSCACIQAIEPEEVKAYLLGVAKSAIKSDDMTV